MNQKKTFVVELEVWINDEYFKTFVGYREDAIKSALEVYNSHKNDAESDVKIWELTRTEVIILDKR